MEDASKYLVTDPLPGIGGLIIFFLIAYGAPWGIARLIPENRDLKKLWAPGRSVWLTTFFKDLPSKKHVPLVTVELRDGRKIVEVLRCFSGEVEDNRELTLARPLEAQASPGALLQPISADFVVLREAEVLYISGLYSELGKAPA